MKLISLESGVGWYLAAYQILEVPDDFRYSEALKAWFKYKKNAGDKCFSDFLCENYGANYADVKVEEDPL